MNLRSKSGDYNSNRDRFAENTNSSVSNPLDNLVDLLSELIEEDSQPETQSSESNSVPNSRLSFNSKENNTVVKKSDRDKIEPQKDRLTINPPQIPIAETNSDKQNNPDISETPNNSIEKKTRESTDSSIDDFDFESKNLLENSNSPIDVTEEESNQRSSKKSNSTNSEDTQQIEASQQWIAEKYRQTEELANYINSLIPVMVQLSKAENNNSQEQILKVITPIIDRIIQERSTEDSEKMAQAIAGILPDAIRQEIKNVPESMGKAIAPEIALAIKEQTLLNKGAIASAMGSEMGEAIKNQIETEKDAMVDALYPVIGNTISKYMNEVVQSINEKVDATLSPVGLKRKIRAKMQGVSEAELILKESVPSSIRAIFLIHNNSGLVIQELQPDSESPLESDLLAGMLTAIRSFANDCIAANSELDEIDYGNFQILFETAGYCYLAVVIEGEPIRQFRDRMRNIFGKIVLKYGKEIEHYQGNPETIPQSMQLFFEELVYESTKSDYNKPPKALYWLIAILLGGILIPWGIAWHRGKVAQSIERAVAVELDANPELSVYRLTPQVKKGELSLTGRVPSVYLKNLAAQVSDRVITDKNLELNNQIIAVNVPADPTVTAQEVGRMTEVLNQNSQNAIAIQYQNGTVTINGLAIEPTAQKKLIATFRKIPGVENVVLIGTQQLPNLETRIYFPSQASQFSLEADSVKIERIERFLNQYPSIKLKVIGHSDRQGGKEVNFKLARARANSVYQALIDRGIASERLQIMAIPSPPPDLVEDSSQPLWLSRCVRFESFIAQSN